MGIRDRFRKWAEYQRTVRELTELDNRSLSDMGINRADIRAIAREHTRNL